MSVFKPWWSLLGMMSAVRPESGRRGWVMLQAPGVNTATFSVLSMISVHLALALVVKWQGFLAVQMIYLEGGLSWQGVANGKAWQLFTHIWLHGNWTHLAINALLFYYAAARLSHVLSSWRIFTLFTVCGVGAGISHMLLQFFVPETPLLVGASGGVTGLLLGFFSISPDSKMILLNISARNLTKGVLVSSALLFVMTPWLEIPLLSDLGYWLESAVGDMIFRTAHLVHFAGGLLGWFLIGRFFPKLLNADDLARMRMERETEATSR
ncbi:rhomboid family intramembrane serine protease [Akkermansiaceae bacterium]|nr:rhomboid family intramembrane serine protease [Akkermansiaceae bacterium]